MKLPRPVLASAAAIAIAAGSISVVNAADKDKGTLLDDAASHPTSHASLPSDAAVPEMEAAAPDVEVGAPVAESAPATGTATGENATAAPRPATGAAAEIGTTKDGGTAPANVKTAVSALTQPGDIDPAIEALAQTVPDQNGTAATFSTAGPAAMRKITSRADAPKKVSGNRDTPQSWYGTKDVEGWYVYSESMGRDIPVALVRATAPDGNPVPNAPTLYMLNGAGGSEQTGDWIAVGDAQKFYRGKGVNVVIPMEGAFSYYVDWLTDGETLKAKSNYFKGAQKWSTFLGKELPPAVERELGANDKRGVLGFSMSGTSSLLLAEHFPGQYAAVGSFSGCAATSTPLPWAFAALTVNRAAKQANYSSLTPAHIWGPMGSPYNRYNDALVNAEKLRNTAIYVSNGSGTASQTDMVGYRSTEGGQTLNDAIAGSMTTTVEGGVIEAATNSCTHDLRAKLNSLNIPAHYEFRKAGTHSWAVWLDDMNRSWNTTFGPALVGGDFVRAQEPELERPTWGGSS